MRGARAEDAAAMAALHASAFAPAESWGEVALRQMLDLPGGFGWIEEGRGFVLARVAADEAEVLTLAVAPASRRHGLATSLVEAVCVTAAAAGAASLFLEVAEDNAAARALYARLGLEPAGRRRGYYGPGRDALVLRRSLQPLRSTSRP